MNQSSASKANELILMRRMAFCSLFLLAVLDGITYPTFANLELYRWLIFTALTGVPLTVWILADVSLRDALKHPWQPLATFLFWPVVLPLYVYRTRGWPGIGALLIVYAAMHGVTGITVVSMLFVSLMLYGFPGPG